MINGLVNNEFMGINRSTALYLYGSNLPSMAILPTPALNKIAPLWSENDGTGKSCFIGSLIDDFESKITSAVLVKNKDTLKTGSGWKKWIQLGLRNINQIGPRTEQTFLRGERTFLRDEHTFLRGEQTFQRSEQTFQRGERTFLRDEHTFLKGEQAFQRGERTFLSGERTFLSGEQTFLRDERTFLRGEQIFQSGERTFLRDEQTIQKQTNNYQYKRRL